MLSLKELREIYANLPEELSEIIHRRLMKHTLSQLSHVECADCGFHYHWSDLYEDFPLSSHTHLGYTKMGLNHPKGKLGFPRQIIECPDCYYSRRRGY